LQREQLRLWFEAVRNIPNPTIAVYLQGLLITGARRNELTGLKWEEVDFQWNSITIRDKVEGERTIPLTPYLAALLRDLQRRNETPPTVRRLNTLKEAGKPWKPSQWVFSSQTSATGRLEEPSIAHRKAIAAAGLPVVSLHGLRRSFGSLSEWCEVPVGVVAQIMGHKPSATAEKHYRERPLDLLRMWHTRIETWLLEQAGIEFKAEQAPQLQAIQSTTVA
jgi:integrase